MNDNKKNRSIWYSGIPNDNKYDFVDETKKATKDHKGFLKIAMLLAIIADALVFAFLLTSLIEFRFFIGPLMLLVADTVFFVLMFFINFRYKYSRVHVAIYILASIIFLALSQFLPSIDEKNLVMEYSGHIILAIGQLVKLIAVIIYAYVAKKPSSNKKGVGLVSLVIVLSMLSAYVVANAYLGFTGQGNAIWSEKCTLLYSENSDGTYYVKDVLGKGTIMEIPEQFNGKNVVGMDCKILNDQKIKKVIINGSNKSFYNIDKITQLNSNIEIVADKNTFDSIRKLVFSQAYSNGGDAKAQALLNVMKPIGLTEDETYYNVFYEGDLPADNVSYIPTIIANKSVDSASVFDTMLNSINVNYIDRVHNDSNNQVDLKWCYENNNGYIFSKNESVVENNKFVLLFDKVIYIGLLEGNDDKYSYDAFWEEFASLSGHGRYLAENKAKTFFNEILPSREGFSCTWSNNGTEINNDTHFEGIVGYLNNKSAYYLKPQWTLLPPEIISTTSEDQSISLATPLTITYGEDAEVKVSAKSILGDDMITYVLSKADVEIARNKTGVFSLEKYLPANSGDYTITAIVEDDAKVLTSLVSAGTTTSFSFCINKKEMTFDWTLPSGQYDGTSKGVIATHNSSEVVGLDVFSYSVSPESVKDAGVYTATITLDEDTAKKYFVSDSNSSKTIVIDKKQVEPIWISDTYIYNGSEQSPTATAEGVDGEDTIVFSIKNRGVNAGAYTAEAVITQTYVGGKPYSENYVIASNATKDYVINKKTLEVVTWSYDTTVYNGQNQHPTVTSVSGQLDNETDVAINDILYSNAVDGLQTNWAVNAKTNYSVKATLSDNSNYTFGIVEYTHGFDILQKTITVNNWTETLFTYDGKKHNPIANGLDGCVAGQTQATLDIIGYTEGQIDKGDYSVTATLPSYSNYKFDVEQSTTYSINARPVVVEWRVIGDDLTYSGMEKEVAATISNVVKREGEVNYDTCEPTVSYVGDHKNAGSFTVNVTALNNANYTTIGGNTTSQVFNITKAPLTITAKDHAITYGDVFANNGVTYEGFVNGESQSVLVGELAFDNTYSQYGNAGTYQLKPSNNCLSSNNYNITMVAGELKVKKAPLTITAKDHTITYGAARTNNGVTYAGFVGSDDSTDLSGTLSFDFTYNLYNDIGTYSLTPKNLSSVNYDITMVAGELTVVAREVSLVWHLREENLIYNGAEKHIDATVGNLVNGDAVTVSTILSSGDCINVDNAGFKYIAIGLEGTKKANYILPTSKESARYNISPSQITIVDTVVNDKVYDGSPNAVVQVGTVKGVYNNEVAVNANAVFVDGNQGVNKSVTVSYSLAAVGSGKLSNYKVPATETRTATIKPKEITIYWTEDDFTYNGTDQSTEVKAWYFDINSNRVELANNLIDFKEYRAEGYAVEASFANGEINYSLPIAKTKTYHIKKAENAITNFVMNDWTVGETASTPSADAKYGEIVFSFCDIETGEFVETKPTEPGVYWVKATVKEGNNYKGAESGPISFEIKAAGAIE